mgnify:CR=1 FL=1
MAIKFVTKKLTKKEEREYYERTQAKSGFRVQHRASPKTGHSNPKTIADNKQEGANKKPKNHSSAKQESFDG